MGLERQGQVQGRGETQRDPRCDLSSKGGGRRFVEVVSSLLY